MIRKKFPPSGLKSMFTHIVKKSLLSSVAFLASSSVQMRTQEDKYQQEFDLAVIGGGSGGLATAF
jgi:hypothetical protein